jgi:hypothetical protein
MDIYVLCEVCDCYVCTTEGSQIIREHPDLDSFICFECQPTNG